METPNPLDTQKFELKTLILQRADKKTPMGVIVDVKASGCVIVKSIQADSAALKGGVKVNDIILFAHGRTIFGRSDLAEAFSAAGLATTIIVARRRGAPLGPPPLPTGQEQKPDCEYLLFRLRQSMEANMKVEWAFADAVVTAKRVNSGGIGESAGLKNGDRLVTVCGESIRDADQLKELLAAGQGAPMDVLIERPPAPKPLAPPPGLPFEPKLDLVTKTLVEQGVSDPSVGVAPPPDDVQLMADQNRDALVAKITPSIILDLSGSEATKAEPEASLCDSFKSDSWPENADEPQEQDANEPQKSSPQIEDTNPKIH